VEKHVLSDLRLYMSHELLNLANLNNTRFIQGTIIQLATVPFSFNPVMDLGSLLQSMMFNFILVNTAWAFVPARIAQFWRIQNEADIGLVTARGLTVLCLMIHDLLGSTLGVIILCAVQSSGFNIRRYTIWNLFAGLILKNAHWTLISGSFALVGMPFPVCNLFQLAEFFCFFYFGGTFSSNSLIGRKASYMSAIAMFMQATTNRSAYPPEAPDDTGPEIERLFFVLWIIFDIFLLFLPMFSLELSELRARRATQRL